MMYFVFQTEQEALSAINSLPFADDGEITFAGRKRHAEHTPKLYTIPIQCVEGWAVIADEFTSRYIQNTPQEITFESLQ